jgi:hypothetical protein
MKALRFPPGLGSGTGQLLGLGLPRSGVAMRLLAGGFGAQAWGWSLSAGVVSAHPGLPPSSRAGSARDQHLLECRRLRVGLCLWAVSGIRGGGGQWETPGFIWASVSPAVLWRVSPKSVAIVGVCLVQAA